MKDENNQKRWKVYVKLIYVFVLFRGLPKLEKPNKEYYRLGIIDSLFTSFITYIIIIVTLYLHPSIHYSVLKSFGIATLIIFFYTQTWNILRMIYYREKWYTYLILKYNLLSFIVYFIIFLLALAFGL